MALGEQILQVEEALALKDGRRIQIDRKKGKPKFDPQKVRDRVTQLSKKLGNKTRAVKAAAKQKVMPSESRIWAILRGE